MNVIARLEYELAYYDSAVHRFNHYTTRTPVEIEVLSNEGRITIHESPESFLCVCVLCDGKLTKIPKRDFIFARVTTGQVGA